MADPQRPRYFEGQVLAAADLTAAVDYARNRAARHDRYLHDWGIAEGLALSTEPMTDPDGGSFVAGARPPRGGGGRSRPGGAGAPPGAAAGRPFVGGRRPRH